MYLLGDAGSNHGRPLQQVAVEDFDWIERRGCCPGAQHYGTSSTCVSPPPRWSVLDGRRKVPAMTDTPTAQAPEVEMNQAAQDELDRRDAIDHGDYSSVVTEQPEPPESAPETTPTSEHAEHAHKAAAKKA